MGSKLFTSMGLENLDLGIVILILALIIIILFVLLIMNMLKISRLTAKYNSFMKGKSAKSLENEIVRMFSENEKMRKDIDEDKKNIRALMRQIQKTYQKMGLIKYDAFDQMGGKLSFCLALLDENANGFVMNSVHSTDSSYCYIKKIENGSATLELSNEETVALNKALHGEKHEAGQN